MAFRKKKEENALEQIDSVLIAQFNRLSKLTEPKRTNSFVLWAKFLESWRDRYVEEAKK